MYQTMLFDQLTPVALYGKIKKAFPNTITMLFESVVNTSEGNFSFITIGAKERLSYQNNTTIYTNASQEKQTLQEDPFSFLKRYYQSIDQDAYQAKAQEVGFSFVDGFIGFIAYDMVQRLSPYRKR